MSASTLPKILIDARMVGPVPHGISRYVSALASGLERMKKESGALAYEPGFLVCREFGKSDFHGFPVTVSKSAFLSPSELIEMPGKLKGMALYHSPSFSSLLTRGPLRPSCPWIVTIHDLNHLTYGSRFQKIYYDRILKPFAQKAAVVATVSEFSRSELADWSGVDPSRIEVVYNAIDPGILDEPSEELCQGVLSRFGLESGRYFLCLSNSKPHKNVPFLIDSYLESRAGYETPWPLVLNLTAFSDKAGVLGLGALSDSDVQVLRARAGVVIFPSLYEGFGLPPVEAAVAGVPLIVSRIAPHLEGLVDLHPDEVRWIEPVKRRSLIDALVEAQKGALRPVSMDSRRKVLERFSELALARHMDQLYRRVLNLSA